MAVRIVAPCYNEKLNVEVLVEEVTEVVEPGGNYEIVLLDRSL